MISNSPVIFAYIYLLLSYQVLVLLMLPCRPNGGTPAARTGADKTAYVRGFDKYQDEDSVGFCVNFSNKFTAVQNTCDRSFRV